MEVLKGWKQIISNTPYCMKPDDIGQYSLRSKLKQSGVVKRTIVGRIPNRRPIVWCYLDDLKYYFDQEQEKRDNILQLRRTHNQSKKCVTNQGSQDDKSFQDS